MRIQEARRLWYLKGLEPSLAPPQSTAQSARILTKHTECRDVNLRKESFLHYETSRKRRNALRRSREVSTAAPMRRQSGLLAFEKNSQNCGIIGQAEAVGHAA
jgi:hypothetical protein